MVNTNSFWGDVNSPQLSEENIIDKYNKYIARTFGYQIKGQCLISEEKRQLLRKKRKKHKKK